MAREKKRIYAILALLYSEDEQFSNYWFGQLSEGSGAQRLRAGIMLKQCRNLNLISRLSMYLVDEDPEAIQYIGDRIVTSPSLASAHAILGIVENSSAVPANVRVSMKGLPDMDVRVTGWTLNWLLENERVLRVKDFGGLGMARELIELLREEIVTVSEADFSLCSGLLREKLNEA